MSYAMGRYELSAKQPPSGTPAAWSVVVSAIAPPWLNPPTTILCGAMPSRTSC